MPFYASACRVKNQRICRSKKIWRQPPPCQCLLLTAADFTIVGVSPPWAGFSAVTDGGGPAPGGSLVPSGMAGTEVLYLLTLDGPIWPLSAPRQLQLRMTGAVPTSVTFTGGDLARSYTFRTDQADVAPPSTSDTWVWYSTFSQPGGGFLFTPGQTYCVCFN
jgi:hypothetical protein